MGTSKNVQKWLAIAVSLVLALSMLPIAAHATEEPTDAEEAKKLIAEQVDAETKAALALESLDQDIADNSTVAPTDEPTDTEIAPLVSTTGVSVDISKVKAQNGQDFLGPIIVRQVDGISDELALYYEDNGFERLWANGAKIDSVKIGSSGFHFEFYGSSSALEGIIVDGTDHVAGGDATLDQEIKINFGTANTAFSLTSAAYFGSAFGLKNGAKVEATINNNATFISSNARAGINVPGANAAGDKACDLAIQGVKSGSTNPPVLTANGGAGAAGIGGNSGDSATPGQNAGNITVKSSVVINAKGGAPVLNDYAGGAGIGGGSAHPDFAGIGGDGGTFKISPLSSGQTISIDATGQQDAAGIGGGAGGLSEGGVGGNGSTCVDASV